MQSSQPTPAPMSSRDGAGGGINRMLSVAGLVVAVAALVLGRVTPGPAGSVGATGATGPQGQAGPTGTAGNGTIAVTNTVSRAGFAHFSASCNHVAGDDISITVPGPGTIVVVAYAWGVNIGHQNTSWDVALLNLGNTPAVCATLTDVHAQIEVPTDEPTTYYYWDATFSSVFTVSASGTYRYYINEYMYSGGNNDDFLDPGVLVATFVPS